VDSLHPVDKVPAISLFCMAEEVAYYDHVRLYEFRVKRKDDGWLAILKGTERDKFRVAFVSGDSLYGVLLNVGEQLAGAGIHWQHDKFPPDWAWRQNRLLP